MESVPTLGQLPAHVLEAVFAYRTCEFSTMAKDGTPITVPTCPVILPESNRLMVTTSIAIPNKAFNVRRDGRVSMLFSDPKASGIANPPHVLIQGDATCPDKVETWTPELEKLWILLGKRQPAASMYSRNALTRWLFDWYYMRLLIFVVPRTIRYWDGSTSSAQLETEQEAVYA